MITFKIDELIPCLKKVETGEIFDTEIVKIKRKSFLSKFNRKTGWYINWSKFDDGIEVYALVLKGTMEIQGLIAVANDDDNQVLEIRWACVSPNNNVWEYNKKEYAGVGGHLFAIAADLSFKRGYEGFLTGEAMDRDLFEYYITEYKASPLPPLNNPYRIMFSGDVSKAIMEVYTYDWKDEEI